MLDCSQFISQRLHSVSVEHFIWLLVSMSTRGNFMPLINTFFMMIFFSVLFGVIAGSFIFKCYIMLPSNENKNPYLSNKLSFCRHRTRGLSAMYNFHQNIVSSN